MPQQTSQQLQSSLNPTPFNVAIPGDGAYITDPQGGAIMIKVGNTLYQTGIEELGRQFANTLGQAKGQAANESGAAARNFGMQYLQSIGFNYNALPQIGQSQIADLYGNASKLGLSFSTSAPNLANIGSMLNTTRTAASSATLNTQQNSLATPAQYAAADAATTAAVGSPRPYTNSAPGTNPNAVPMSGGYVATPGTPGATGAASQNNAQLAALLNNPSLSGDQKTMVQSIYDAIAAGDQAKADQIKAAISAASQYSDPYFKAQIWLATDALDRGLQAKDGDLAFEEEKLRTSLQRLKDDTASASNQLDFQQQQDLKDLQRNQEAQLSATQDDLAARGFTTSSVRASKEKLIGDTFGSMREGTQRAFFQKNTDLSNTLSRSQQDTAAQIANLQRLTQEGKIDALRQTEEKVGSSNLASYGNVLGGVGGQIPRAQALDQVSFANSFTF